jgi:hypothetical protein
MNNAINSTLRRAAIAIEILRERLRMALAPNLGDRAARVIERALWWLLVAGFVVATVLAVAEGVTDAPSDTPAEIEP